MRVAIVCPYSYARPGGVQEHTRGLASALCAMGHEVLLFAPDAREGEDVPGAVTVSLGGSVAIPSNGSLAPIAIDPRMLVRMDLALDPADVIHVHEPLLPACLAANIRAPEGVPVVGTFHAAAARSLPYAVGGRLLRRAVRRLKRTTAVSPAAAELARRYLPVAPEIVPNGIDAGSFAAAEPDPWAAGLGIVVLFVGRPEPRKGFELLVRAFAGAAAPRPDAHLVCVPAPAGSASVISHEVAPRVHCLGPVTGERLRALYAAADIVCAPSLGRESFGLVVAEGMAAGAAVIASDLPGYRFAGAGVPVYVAPGDLSGWRTAIARLLDDEGERSTLGARGPERARSFDWPVVAARTLAVYEDARG